MANTLGTPIIRQRGAHQFQGLFNDMWVVTIPVSDQDAIADDVSVTLTATIPGLALGDLVLFAGFNKSQSDANASVALDCFVSAANTVTVKLTNVDDAADAYDADTLTDGVLKLVIGRPTW